MGPLSTQKHHKAQKAGRYSDPERKNHTHLQILTQKQPKPWRASYLANDIMAFWVDGARREGPSVASRRRCLWVGRPGQVSSSWLYLLGRKQPFIFLSCICSFSCFSSHFCDPFLYHLTAQRLQVLSYSNQRISTSQLLRVWSPVHTGLLLRGRARPGFPHSSV